MLYNPPAFRDDDPARLAAQVAEIGLATLITESAAGVLVSHLPLVFDPEPGPKGALLGHLARVNPQAHESDLTRPALAVFLGPQAYVSPSWYPSKREHGQVVPTWNYSVVHARGRLEIFADRELLLAQLDRMTRFHEDRVGETWKVADAPADYLERQLRAIVGIRLTIETLEGKTKMSQGRPAADLRGVEAALLASPRDSDRAAGRLMKDLGERR